MLLITGTITASPDSPEEVETLSLAHGVHRDVDNPLRLVFLEKWIDQASVDAHFSVPESGAFVREVTRLSGPLFPPTLEVFEVVPHR